MILALEALTMTSSPAYPAQGQYVVVTANLVGTPGEQYSLTAYATLAGTTQVEGHFFTAPNPVPNVTPWTPATGVLPGTGTAVVTLYSGPVSQASDYQGYSAAAGLDLHLELNGADNVLAGAIFLPSAAATGGGTVGTGPAPATPLPTTTISYAWGGAVSGTASVTVSGPVNQLPAGTYTGNPPSDPVSAAAKTGLEAGTFSAGFVPAVTGSARTYLEAVWAAGFAARQVGRYGGGQPGTVNTISFDSSGNLLSADGQMTQAINGMGGWANLLSQVNNDALNAVYGG